MTPRLFFAQNRIHNKSQQLIASKYLNILQNLEKIIHDLSTAQYLCELLDILFGKLLPIKCSQSLDKIQAQVAGLSVDFLKQNFYNTTIDKK